MRHVVGDQQERETSGLLLEAQQALGGNEDGIDASCGMQTPHRLPEPGGRMKSPQRLPTSQGDGIARALRQLGEKQREHEGRIEAMLSRNNAKQEERIADMHKDMLRIWKLEDMHKDICQAGDNDVSVQSFVDQMPTSVQEDKDQCIFRLRRMLEEDDKWISPPHLHETPAPPRHQMIKYVSPPHSPNQMIENPHQMPEIGDLVEDQVVGEDSPKTIRSNKTGLDEAETLQSHAQILESVVNFRKSVTKAKQKNHGLLEDSPCRHMAARITTDRRFEYSVCALIVSNAFIMGVEANFEMTNPQADDPLFLVVANTVFVVFFTTELILRLVAEASSFFSMHNEKFRWNIFDSILVTSAIIEEVLAKIDTSANSNMSVMRVLRTMRVVRSFRVIRAFSFFRDLRIMVSGIMSSAASLMWAISLLAMVMFIFSVCFMQFAIAENVAQTSPDRTGASLGPQDYADLLKYFGSLPTTMITLYMSIVGGIDWADAATPILQMNWYLGLLYFFYVAFAVLCVLNIVTGVFVENAMKRNKEDDEMVMMEQLDLRTQWLQEVKVLFDKADADGNGRLGIEEFKKMMADFRLQAFLSKLGVHVESYCAAGLFNLLDFDGDGKLNIDEFVTNLQLVHGPAKSVDVVKLSKDTKRMHRDIKELKKMFADSRQPTSQDLPRLS